MELHETINTRLTTLKSWVLSKRQLCDLECLLTDVYFPLKGFLQREDYDSVCHTMRLKNGTLWPIPITLDVSSRFAAECEFGEEIILTNEENTPLATMVVQSIWKPNKKLESQLVFGTTDKQHPAVAYLHNQAGDWYLGGEVSALRPIVHYDFLTYRHTPAELKQLFKIYGWSKIIAFQTRNPIHRAHYELMHRAAQRVSAQLLIHPVIGMTKPGDVDHVIRVKCYEQVLKKFPKNNALLSLLPIAMRMAGPREAIWHAIIRKNHGVTHFIIGRDHAGPGFDSQGKPFYEPYEAQKVTLELASEIGINIIPFPSMVYVKEKTQFLATNEIGSNDTVEDISGTELRRRLEHCEPIPEWFSFPEVINILKNAYPSKLTQGFTIFFTGLPSSGKSTIANALLSKILESNSRLATLLDGDIVRQNLSSELGFSKADREKNILRIGYVASEITKHKGIAICAAIAPFADARLAVRKKIQPYGGFIEVYISTSSYECEKRDLKGLYKKAKTGAISGFTGVNDPYEIPQSPDLTIDTATMNVMEAVEAILEKIESLGFSWR